MSAHTLAAVPSVDAIGDLPVAVRQALVPHLVRFTEQQSIIDSFGYSLTIANARTALNLDQETGEDRLPRFWFTFPNDLHPMVIRFYRDVVTERTFLIEEPTPVLTAEADTSARDAQAKALATMRRRESMALADRAAADARIRDLEHRLSIAQVERAATVPWGPRHPDWHDFWLQAARDAERAGNCGEYDRHAEEMGAPTRADFRREGADLDGRRFLHTYDISISFQVLVSGDGDGADEDDITDAIHAYIENNGADQLTSDYSSTHYNSERDHDADVEDVWTNPGTR